MSTSRVSRIGSILCMASATVLSQWVHAIPDADPDPNASVVYLRTSCDVGYSDAGESPLENCFEKMLPLKNWIYARPDLTKPLLIDIGPGQFTTFACGEGAAGNLVFRGAGVDKTIISGVKHYNCESATWSFSDLTVAGAFNAVEWLGSGESTWHNVVLKAPGASWYDTNSGGGLEDPCPAGQQGVHRFFSSRLISTGSTLQNSAVGAFGFLNACGDNWLWGSEIVFSPAVGKSGTAIVSRGAGNRIHLYGSNLRAEAYAGAGAPDSVTAMTVYDGAEVHSHGVGIDVVGNPGMILTALSVSSGGEVHANESSYFMQPATGATLRRIVNTGGHVHAPFMWAEHDEPPVVTSVTGADTAIVKNTADGHPHMVVYDASCASHWYDMTISACR